MEARSFARKRMEELLKPDGEVLGEKPRQNRQVRRVAAGVDQARAIFEELAKLGHDSPVAGNPGHRIEILDLGHVNYREVSRSGPPSLDVSVNIEGLQKVRFKFVGASETGESEGGENP